MTAALVLLFHRRCCRRFVISFPGSFIATGRGTGRRESLGTRLSLVGTARRVRNCDQGVANMMGLKIHVWRPNVLAGFHMIVSIVRKKVDRSKRSLRSEVSIPRSPSVPIAGVAALLSIVILSTLLTRMQDIRIAPIVRDSFDSDRRLRSPG